MRKLLSLLLVPLFSAVFLLTSFTLAFAEPCTFTSVTAAIAPGSTVEIRGTGVSGHVFIPVLTNSQGNLVDPGGNAHGAADAGGQISFTFSAPTTDDTYTVRLFDTGGIGGTSNPCTGSGSLNVAPSHATVANPNAPAELGAIVTVIKNIIKLLVPIAAVAFFIMFLVGGVQFLLSGGDPKAAGAARNTLTYAVIGIILVVISWLILLVIKNVTGVDVTTVSLPL